MADRGRTTPDGARGQRVVLVGLVVVIVLIVIAVSVEQRLRADFEVLDRPATTGTDLGDPLPEPEPMPPPAPGPNQEGGGATRVDDGAARSASTVDSDGR